MYKKTTNTISFTTTACSLGQILIAKSAKGLCLVAFADEDYELIEHLRQRFRGAQYLHREVAEAAQIVAHLENPALPYDVLFDVTGTAFQQQVWQALKTIPVGTTVSYTDIAKKIGSPKAVRAVAQACGANPLAVLIPCHRVVRQDGSLSGYRWGIERKRALLAREKRLT